MNDSLKTKAISKSGLLLKNILDISNVGQRECAENMDEHDQYLRNYIYTDKNRYNHIQASHLKYNIYERIMLPIDGKLITLTRKKIQEDLWLRV